MSLLQILKFITSHPLNRESKLESIVRFFRWQVGSRLVPGAIAYEWINGSRFLVRTGETGLTGNIYTGLHEFSDMAFLLHLLREDDLFVDVGANMGSYTILASAAIGARSYAFEPVPGTYRRLVENMRLNRLDEKVVCINKAVGAERGTTTFTTGCDSTNHALALGEHSEHTTDVDICTLDEVLADELPTLIKIDVEGFETPVLDGACKTLSAQTLQSVIIELNGSGRRYGFDDSQSVQRMLDHGFKAYAYLPMERRLAALKGKSPEPGNTLFVRDESFVLGRLKRSPKITVHGKRF